MEKKTSKTTQTHPNSGENLQILRNSDDPFDPAPSRPKLTREELLNGGALTKDSLDTIKDPRFKSPDDFLKRIAPKKEAVQPPTVVEPQSPPPYSDPIPAPAPFNGTLRSDKISPHHFGIPDLSQIRKDLQTEREEKSKAKAELPETLSTQNGHHVKIDQVSLSKIFATAKIAPDEPVVVTHAPAPLAESTLEVVLKEKDKIAKELFQWKEYAEQVKLWQGQVMNIVKNMKSELKKTQNSQDEIVKLKEQLKQKDAEILKLQENGSKKIIGWMKGFGRTH